MQEVWDIFKEAGTAVIADVFDSMGLLPPVLDNALHWVSPTAPFAAPACTVAGQPERYTGSDRAKLGAIDNMPAGSVAVWASSDAKGVCCFGDLLASAMRVRGCVAAVVDGGVRDTAFLAEFGMPVIARYRTPAQGVGRWRVTDAQVPVRVRGALEEWVTVAPGDLVVGDADGIVVVPKALTGEMEARVREWASNESGARAEILGGLPLLAALAKYGHL